MTIDLALRRAELLRLRERILGAAAELAADDEGVGELSSAAGDQHIADHASDLVDLEVDQSLVVNADNVIVEIDDALEAHRGWDLRAVRGLWRGNPGGAARGSPVRHPLPRRQATTGNGVSEPVRADPPRRLDVRVGSSTNALQPISSAERRLGAGLSQWIALGVIAGTAIVADQLTKSIVSLRLPTGEAVATLGPFSIHHVQNTGIAFGLFADSTTAVIVLTTTAVAAMLVFFGRTAQRHPLLPVALGLVIGGSIANLIDRVRLGHVTDFLDFDYWPAFNLADTFIVVGVGLLFASFVASDRTSPRLGTAPLSRP